MTHPFLGVLGSISTTMMTRGSGRPTHLGQRTLGLICGRTFQMWMMMMMTAAACAPVSRTFPHSLVATYTRNLDIR